MSAGDSTGASVGSAIAPLIARELPLGLESPPEPRPKLASAARPFKRFRSACRFLMRR